MPIVNRDLDPSQQRDIYDFEGGTVTGQTYPVCIVPYPAQIVAAELVCTGLSGSPNMSLWLQRFVVGSGVTSISLGASIVAVAFATSGAQGFSLTGATNLLQAGDLVLLSQAAANTAAVQTNVTVVLRALQDIKTDYGV